MKKITLIDNTLAKVKYSKWTYIEAFTYFLKGVARELNIAPSFFLNFYEKIYKREFNKRWLYKDSEISFFNFKGAKLPDVSGSRDVFNCLKGVFEDTFLFPCIYGDNYDKTLVRKLDAYMNEGPYGYTDGNFDVTVKKNDVVIDAGAWIGDFSAYAVSKGATAYAFEPVSIIFNVLRKTEELNKGKIFPVQKGLGDREYDIHVSMTSDVNTDYSISMGRDLKGELVSIITLDKFVEENKLERIDFIKADIEGAERDMLRGATNVLKTFAPKLAICTYHLPDDPEVLEQIIKEANPNYTIIHLRKKLFAAVIR